MSRYLYKRMNRELRKMKFRALGSGALIIIAVSAYIGMASMVPSASETLEIKIEELKLSDYIVHVNSSNESDLERISAIDGIEETDYRLALSSRLRHVDTQGETLNFSAALVGIDPGRYPRVNSFYIPDGDGNFFEGNGSGTALLEKGFAKKQNIRPGDQISLLIGNGFVNLTVSGLVFSAEHIFLPFNPQSIVPIPGTLAVVYLPIDWLRDSFGLNQDYFNEFTMLFEAESDQGALRTTVDEQLSANIIIYSIPKDQIYGYALIKEDLSSGESFAGVIAFIILLVAFFVVYSSFARIVQEQRKEIGVLRALGYSRRSVWISYLYMAAVIGFFSSIIGILVAIPFAQWMADFYVREALFTTLESFQIPISSVIIGGIFGPLTACLACGVAVWATVSMEPQAAIRGLNPGSEKIRLPRKVKEKRRVPRSTSFMRLYAYRNISRHKARTALTITAVGMSIMLGSASLVMISSFINSIEYSVEEYENWDLIVEYSYPLIDSTADTISTQDISERVQIARIAGDWIVDGKSGSGVIIGLNQQQELHEFILFEGEISSTSGEAMVDYLTAENNGILPGDSLIIAGSNGNETLIITGIVEDMMGNIFVDLATVERLSGTLVYSGMYVTIAGDDAEAVKMELMNSPLVADVRMKEELSSGIIDLMDSYSQILYIFSLVGITIATITIANIVYVGILERYAEYGQLRAIGYSKKEVSRSILTEIAIIIAISGIVGIPLMLLTLEGTAEQFKTFFPMYQAMLKLEDWGDYVFVMLLTFLFGFLAAIPGIRRLNKMDIAKAVSGGQFG